MALLNKNVLINIFLLKKVVILLYFTYYKYPNL